MSEQSVSLISGSGKSTEGKVLVESIAFSKRLLKTMLLSSIILAVAVCSVAIPLLHFILPFLFLGLAIYVGQSTFRQKTFIKSGEGLCPECNAKFKISNRTLKFPFFDVCESCRREIRITLPD